MTKPEGVTAIPTEEPIVAQRPVGISPDYVQREIYEAGDSLKRKKTDVDVQESNTKRSKPHHNQHKELPMTSPPQPSTAYVIDLTMDTPFTQQKPAGKRLSSN